MSSISKRPQWITQIDFKSGVAQADRRHEHFTHGVTRQEQVSIPV
jgi:hypothetical protein